MRRDERQKGKSEARIKISQMKRGKGIILKYYECEGVVRVLFKFPPIFSLLHPHLPHILPLSCTFPYLINVAMHFTVPVSPPVSSQAFSSLSLSSPSAPPTTSPSHSSRSHSLSLSLAHSLCLSHSLTEADVGQCVWSLSGTGERA